MMLFLLLYIFDSCIFFFRSSLALVTGDVMPGIIPFEHWNAYSLYQLVKPPRVDINDNNNLFAINFLLLFIVLVTKNHFDKVKLNFEIEKIIF